MDTDKCIYSVTSLSALLQKIFSLCSTNLEVEGKNYLFFKKLANGQFALELKRRKKERKKQAGNKKFGILPFGLDNARMEIVSEQ